jgi:hypothetical protein
MFPGLQIKKDCSINKCLVLFGSDVTRQHETFLGSHDPKLTLCKAACAWPHTNGTHGRAPLQRSSLRYLCCIKDIAAVHLIEHRLHCIELISRGIDSRKSDVGIVLPVLAIALERKIVFGN